MRLEQAVFTSVRSTRLDGYQLAAVSNGVSERVARELSTWGPAHDSLRSQQPGATSFNFHPLPDEQYCLSKTTLSGSEYSGRGGGRVYTQMLIAPREALTRFACDPWLILQAVEAAGRLIIYDTVPPELQPVPLLGRGSPPPAAQLAAVAAEVGAECVADLAAALVDAAPVSVITNVPAERLIQAALHQLSETERLAVSFTTGLRQSARRPFRVSILPDDPALARESQRAGSKVIEALAAAPI